MVYGIMAAMPEEIEGVVKLVENPEIKTIGGRDYISGTINDKNVIVVFSRWGKVAAASTVTTLIDVFNVNQILFTGIAGGIHTDLKVGDVVVASSCVFHDMDTRPLHDRYVVPLLNIKYFDVHVTDGLIEKLQNVFDANNISTVVGEQWADYFNLSSVMIVNRPIASGDQFVNSQEIRNDIQLNLSDVACVEMEGAAVAQICFEHNIPCTIVRTISDSANDAAAVDFEPFAKYVASNYSIAIVSALLSD
jgi:adenosylhomocysteine nucleosidase